MRFRFTAVAVLLVSVSVVLSVTLHSTRQSDVSVQPDQSTTTLPPTSSAPAPVDDAEQVIFALDATQVEAVFAAAPVAADLDPAQFAERIVQCGQAAAGEACFRAEELAAVTDIVAMVHSHSPTAALDEMRRQLDAGAVWAGNCHNVAHAVGHEATVTYTLLELFDMDERMCTDGFLDGVMEGFADATSGAEFWLGVRHLCDTYPVNSWKASSCAHGIGHALVRRVDRTYAAAATHCLLLQEVLQSSCGTGVMMALAVFANMAGGTTADTGTAGIDALVRTCDDLAPSITYPCLFKVWILAPATTDPEQLISAMADNCTRQVAAEVCFMGVGYAIFEKVANSIEARGETPAETQQQAAVLLERCREFGDGAAGCAYGIGWASAVWHESSNSSTAGFASPCVLVDAVLSDGCSAGVAAHFDQRDRPA